MGLAAPGAVEQAQIDPLGMGREQREIDTRAVPACAQGVGRSGLDFQCRHHRLRSSRAGMLYATCSKMRVASGGKVSRSENGRLWQEVPSLTTPPALPTLEPP